MATNFRLNQPAVFASKVQTIYYFAEKQNSQIWKFYFSGTWEVHGASKRITIIETIFYRNNNSGMFKTQSQDKNGFWPLKWYDPDNFSPDTDNFK